MSLRVLCSGGFDPLHVGHVEYLQRAAAYGDVIVALNSDEWLIRKKGYTFMPWAERARILEALRYVRGVIPVDDTDGSVCAAIRDLRPRVFAKGGDRNADNCPEAELCAKMGVSFVAGLGDKVQSSSNLASGLPREVERPWGGYRTLYTSKDFKVKVLRIEPGQATSMQRHHHRSEAWVSADGSVNHLKPGEWHQLSNETDAAIEVIEIQTGDQLLEGDIERAV